MLKQIIYIFLVILFFNSCKTSQKNFYTYKIDTYTIDSLRHFLSTSSVISFGDYLFEFNLRTNIKSEQHGELSPVVSSFTYDTIGVYLLGSKNKLYNEYDSFTLKNKLVKTGFLSEKQFGQNVSVSNAVNPDDFLYGNFNDTSINNIKCYYVNVYPKEKKLADSIQSKLILFKGKDFNSLIKISGSAFFNKQYCIIGFSFYNYKQKQGISQEINSLRYLTKEEERICENMLGKSRKQILTR